jgi:hypothetical protein
MFMFVFMIMMFMIMMFMFVIVIMIMIMTLFRGLISLIYVWYTYSIRAILRLERGVNYLLLLRW